MKAVLFDRDGVLNEDRGDYVRRVDQLHVIPQALSALKLFNANGYKAFVISNQAGISKGLYSKDELFAIDNHLRKLIDESGGKIEKSYYCLHQDSDGCDCRKPKTGLFEQLKREYSGIAFAGTYFIGDSQRDAIAAKSAGCKSMIVFSGKSKPEDIAAWKLKPDAVANNLVEAAEKIIGEEN